MSGSIQSLISTIRDIVEIKKSRTWNKYKNHDSKTMGGQVLYAFPSLFPRTSTGFRKHIASSNSHFEYANNLPTPCEHLANTLPTPCQLGTSTSSVSPCMADRWREEVVPFYFVTCLTAFCSLLLNLLTALFPPFLKS